ncbi:MAG: hypothetical protein LBC18_05020 [Opitutaceae bacterium]|nr:hypothetical protein [Opitutaceae bacterium]
MKPPTHIRRLPGAGALPPPAVTAPAGGAGPATAGVFYYDAETSQYAGLKSSDGAVDLGHGRIWRH